MKAIGGFAYTEEERAFAEEIQKHLLQPRPIGSQEEVMEWRRTPAGGSTDVADVSWVGPDGAVPDRHLGARDPGAQLDGGGLRRDEHRTQGHAPRGPGARAHRG